MHQCSHVQALHPICHSDTPPVHQLPIKCKLLLNLPCHIFQTLGTESQNTTHTDPRLMGCNLLPFFTTPSSPLFLSLLTLSPSSTEDSSEASGRRPAQSQTGPPLGSLQGDSVWSCLSSRWREVVERLCFQGGGGVITSGGPPHLLFWSLV